MLTPSINKCRICESTSLEPILDIGIQELTGVFPSTRKQKVTAGPLQLVKCFGECGLLQLAHSFDSSEMYGEGYGYRSGVNTTMTKHLQSITKKSASYVNLEPGDIVLDIGSNDGTLLKSYPTLDGLQLIGIDPSATKFKGFYPDSINLVVDFFSANAFRSVFESKKAKIVTSIAMFYDLEHPLDFVNNIREIISDDGIWVFEQSYMPLMIEKNAYDTICHEHLEYYGLQQIKWMLDKADLKILNVELNDINGGSFQIIATPQNSKIPTNSKSADNLIQKEIVGNFHKLEPYQIFKKNIFKHRDDLLTIIKKLKKEKKTIYGYGASTKGNVILQFCKLGPDYITAIADRNPIKNGLFTPGMRIPIMSEEKARELNPDIFLILPWHFKAEFLKRESSYLKGGGNFLFPLPEIELVK